MPKTRTPFDLQTSDLSAGLSDKSADKGLEVKTLDTEADTEAEAANDPVEPAPEPADGVTVRMLHHYATYVPGDEPTLDARLANSLIAAHRAKLV